MYARVNMFEGPPDLVDQALGFVQEQVLPELRQQDGFKGLVGLVDRQSGKVIGVTLWESEQAMRASEEAADRLRRESAEAGGETIASVDRCEVVIFEVPTS